MRVLAKALAPLLRHWRRLAILMLCVAAGLAQAQSAIHGNSADPPSRVARLSYVAGDLGFLPSGAKDWSEASINRPLTTGDRLSTGQASRAELELGGGTMRLAGGTDFGFLTLDDQLAQIELMQGTLNLAIRQLDQGQDYEIDTPTLALVINQPGTFRIDIGRDGQSTRVTVFDGAAVAYGENGAQRDVTAGLSYDFGNSALDNLVITGIGGGDDFDAWCSARDQSYAQSVAAQYVSDDVVGYQDLDSYGDWQDVDDYGAVWFPTEMAAGWAPYSDGYWSYIAPWGWTWVDALPWGFAPYHYGRWAFIHGAWGWLPGPRMRHPVYAPALVAFVGVGGGTSIGVGGRPVGWFPLGPGEIYNPWYPVSSRYYSNVNLSNINLYRGNSGTLISSINSHYIDFLSGRTVPNANYVNRSAPHALTVVSGQSFANASAVQRNRLQVNPRLLAAAPVLARGIGVQPVAASLAPLRSAQARALPTGSFQRQVIARQAPALKRTSSRSAITAQSVSNVRVLTTGTAASATGFHGSTHPGAIVPQSRQGPGELPSAHHTRPDNTQRPGVSFISNASEDNQRAEFPTTGLPQVPHFQNANPGQAQPVDQSEQRYDAARSMHDNVPTSAYRGMPTQQPYYGEAPSAMPEQDFQHTQPSPSIPRDASQPPAHAEAKSQPSRGSSDDDKH